MTISILINEYWYFILLIVFAAASVGFFAGLFGIGGGLISVPCLFFIFETLNIEKDYLMHLTVGTAFTITIFTSSASVFTHYKNKLVDTNVVKTFGLFVVTGVLLGTIFAAYMTTKNLVLFFSVIVYIFGAYLMLANKKVNKVKVNRAFYPKAIFGLISGFISAPMGITGAMMNVPLLRYLGYPISKCIGSAATIGLFISLTGSLGFLISGFYFSANLPFSVGFINIPAFLLFVPITTFMATFGANTVYKMDKTKAQRLFGVFLYAIGTIFIYRYFNI